MKVQYQEQIVKELKEKFNYTNDMQIPKLDKIVLNMGLGDAVAESKKS
jgi:large subunit ribosomal protein L5